MAITRLIENYISLNTWNVYDNAVKTLESFRCEMSLEQKWPVPLSDLINFIAFLSKNDASARTFFDDSI
jgi:hypothetical protein